MIRVGDGDGDDSRLGPGARRLIASNWRPPGDGISCANGKDGNRFYMGARALGYASTSVEGDVIRIMREDGRDAAAPVPNAVMSVLHQHARANLKGSARAGARVGGLLLAEKPLTVGGFV